MVVVVKRPRARWTCWIFGITSQTTVSIERAVPIDAGRILTTGGQTRRRRKKFADYLLCYTRDFFGNSRSKAEAQVSQDGLQQAKEYAELLGLKFAYSTNGTGIVEFDYTTGLMTSMEAFPAPAELWARLKQAEGLMHEVADKLLTP